MNRLRQRSEFMLFVVFVLLFATTEQQLVLQAGLFYIDVVIFHAIAARSKTSHLTTSQLQSAVFKRAPVISSVLKKKEGKNSVFIMSSQASLVFRFKCGNLQGQSRKSCEFLRCGCIHVSWGEWGGGERGAEFQTFAPCTYFTQRCGHHQRGNQSLVW